MRKVTLGAAVCFSALVTVQGLAATITVDPTQSQARISPYIYGANQVTGSSVKFTAWRQGGNRLTGYNWENNFSNAGSDWQQSSDTYLCNTPATCTAPGATITSYVDAAKAAGAYPLVTLQMAGYVSADSSGTVTEAQVAPSARWKEVVASKGSAFALTPDLTDGKVYMDELVNFLVKRYGLANAGGIPGYALDNEPDLWNSTHPRIHPNACGAVELVERSVALAAAIKAVDPAAETFGFVSYGYAGYLGLQDATDWASVKGSYQWYVQYFLAQMAAASQKAGKRLLDVIDLHYYSEARGGDTRVQEGTTANAAARVQSTRSLWDPSYDYSATDPTVGENSWITQWNDAIALIPRVHGYIRTLYPDTKFAITEYDFGAASHISGGIAEADALGIYGREGVYFASRWGDPGTYTDAAYQLYLNYDGKGSRFGDVSVKASTSDVVNVPSYAAIDQSNPSLLHIILINRNLTTVQTAAVTIGGTSNYGSGQAWGFDSTSPSLTDRGAIAVTGNAFSLSLPALSAMHVVLTTDTPTPITGIGGAAGAGGTTATTPSLNGGSGGVAGGASGGDSDTTEGGATTKSVGGKSSKGGATTKPKGDDDPGSCGCRIAQRDRSVWSLALLAGAVWLLRRRR